MIEYTREEALELADSLIKKLSSRIEALSDMNITDCNKLEISIYLQQNGKEFISLVDKKDIKNELAEYNNQTIAIVLSKIIPSAIEFGLEKNLSKDFCIVDTSYNTNAFEIYKERKFLNPKASWTMQNSDWGDKWRYISEEKIKELNDRLSAALKELGYSDEKILGFLETEIADSSSVILLREALAKLYLEKKKSNKQIENLDSDEIKQIEIEMDEIRNNITLSAQERKERLQRKNALHIHKSMQLEKRKKQNADELERLKNKIERIKKEFLYNKIYSSGCKIVSMAKIFSAMYDDESITPNVIMQYVDEEGLISDDSLKSVYKDYKVTRVKEKDIANYVFPRDCYIIGQARIGGGLGEHFVVIKSITSTVKNGMVILKYEKSNSSDNDEIRDYSSEEPGNDSRKAKVIELRVFERGC